MHLPRHRDTWARHRDSFYSSNSSSQIRLPSSIQSSNWRQRNFLRVTPEFNLFHVLQRRQNTSDFGGKIGTQPTDVDIVVRFFFSSVAKPLHQIWSKCFPKKHQIDENKHKMVVCSKIVAVYKTYVVMRIFRMERVLFFFLYYILMVVVIVVNWYCCCSRALLSYSKCLPVWPGAGRIASTAQSSWNAAKTEFQFVRFELKLQLGWMFLYTRLFVSWLILLLSSNFSNPSLRLLFGQNQCTPLARFSALPYPSIWQPNVFRSFFPVFPRFVVVVVVVCRYRLSVS